MSEPDFIKHYIANASQMMWFLGAGASRTAGMPTATDIIWKLKIAYYCREENQDIKSHDLNNEVVKRRVQSYMDSKGYPALWSVEEYSHYFELAFGNNYSDQQQYLAKVLNSGKISLNIGHRALAGLVHLNKVKLIFTTNFDEVVEAGVAKVSGKTIPTYHLEGNYAALSALNAERFPIYIKLHGDFKYQSVKNLSRDLLANDKELQKCFLAASSRYGMIITGYSGRDSNVMSMFDMAISRENAFPSGLFWTVPSLKDTRQEVIEFIEKANSKGINAHIVETGTFDSMLSKIWRQVPDKDAEINSKVRTATLKEVNIPLFQTSNNFPILRTNALPIVEVSNRCARVETVRPLSNFEVKELLTTNKGKSIVNKAELILAWGSQEQIIQSLGNENVSSISKHEIENPIDCIAQSTHYHRFYERAIVMALREGKPLFLKNDKSFYLSVDPTNQDNSIFNRLRAALADKYGNPGQITGIVTGETKWSEAVKIKIEHRDGKIWLLLKPTIWIEPSIEKRNQIDFVRKRLGFRYNTKANSILDAWISILLGTQAKNQTVELSCFSGTEYPMSVKINSRTAFSGK